MYKRQLKAHHRLLASCKYINTLQIKSLIVGRLWSRRRARDYEEATEEVDTKGMPLIC